MCLRKDAMKVYCHLQRQQRLLEGDSKGSKWQINLAGGGDTTRTTGGARYFMTLNDDDTDTVSMHTLKRPSESSQIQYNRSDDKFRGRKVVKISKEHGFLLGATAPDSPQEYSGRDLNGYELLSGILEWLGISG